MSTLHDLKTINLATPAQWGTGLASRIRIDAGSTAAGSALAGGTAAGSAAAGGTAAVGTAAGSAIAGLAPVRPFNPQAALLATGMASRSLTATPHQAVYWLGRDPDGSDWLYWQNPGSSTPCRIEARPEWLDSPRLIIGLDWLWCWQPGQGRLLRHDALSLQFDASIHPWHGGTIVDACSDGQDGVWVLARAATPPQARAVHVDRHGDVRQTIRLADDAAHVDASGTASGIAWLARSKRLALLVAEGRALLLLDTRHGGHPPATIALADSIAGFRASFIDGDRQERILLAGSNDSGTALLAVLDPDGEVLDTLQPPAAQQPLAGGTMLADGGSTILLAGPQGICRYHDSPAANGNSADGLYLSAPLYSPDDASLRGWLRAELTALLPRESGMVVTLLYTGDRRVRDQAAALAQQRDLPPGTRIAKILALLESGQSFVFASGLDDKNASAAGAATSAATSAVAGTATGSVAGTAAETLAVPLFAVKAPWLWLLIRLHAAPLGELPLLARCRVHYPDVSLMQYLPAIFRGDLAARGDRQGDPSGFFRDLVGLLETTTQGIDHLIGQLGRIIGLDTAQGPWLDFMARWLALPWHDALAEAEKRRVLQHGAAILAMRGTREGVLALLRALLPAARVSLTDSLVDWGLAVVGASTLPALLSGLPPDASVLNRRATVGLARLPTSCTDSRGERRFIGILRITITADSQQHATLAALLPELVQELLPLGTTALIHWRAEVPPGMHMVLDSGARMNDPGPRRLNHDSLTGMIVLAGSRHHRLGSIGTSPGFPLK